MSMLDDLAAAQKANVDRLAVTDYARIRRATVTAIGATCTITMSGVSIAGVPYLPSYSPVVNDIVLVLMDGAAPLILDRTSSGGQFQSFTPGLSASTTPPTLGTGAVREGRFTRDGRRISGALVILWGTAGTAVGSGTYYISGMATARPWAGVNTIKRIGGGNWYDQSANKLYEFTLDSDNTGLIFMRYSDDLGGFHDLGSADSMGANDIISIDFDYEAST